MFFFSSRRRHTRSYGDWSSDVCSSDLERKSRGAEQKMSRSPSKILFVAGTRPEAIKLGPVIRRFHEARCEFRSEERRVGKECRARWAREHDNKKKSRDHIESTA